MEKIINVYVPPQTLTSGEPGTIDFVAHNRLPSPDGEYHFLFEVYDHVGNRVGVKSYTGYDLPPCTSITRTIDVGVVNYPPGQYRWKLQVWWIYAHIGAPVLATVVEFDVVVREVPEEVSIEVSEPVKVIRTKESPIQVYLHTTAYERTYVIRLLDHRGQELAHVTEVMKRCEWHMIEFRVVVTYPAGSYRWRVEVLRYKEGEWKVVAGKEFTVEVVEVPVAPPTPPTKVEIPREILSVVVPIVIGVVTAGVVAYTLSRKR